MKAWAQKESMAMLRLQEAFEASIKTQTGSDTDEGDDLLPNSASRRTRSIKLSRRLRGWLFLLRSGIQRKDTSVSYAFKKIRRALITLFPDKVLK